MNFIDKYLIQYLRIQFIETAGKAKYLVMKGLQHHKILNFVGSYF